ncbi:MAG: phosphatase PAP2 family protein [Allobranchiibius sp.]
MSASTVKRPPQRLEQRGERSVWGPIAGMLALAVVSLALLALVLVRTRTGSRYDHDAEWALGGPPWLFYNIEARLRQVSVAAVGVVGLLLAGIAVLRRRVGLALGILVLIGGATVTTQLLKSQVIQALPGNLTNSMPSGHATVGISLSLAALIALPVAWQLFVLPACAAIGFFFGAGTVIGHWHHPGDVLAALAVCLAWAAAALGVAHVIDNRRPARLRPAGPHRVGPDLALTLWLVLGGISLVCLLFLAWGAQPSRYVLRDVVLGMTAVFAIAAVSLLVYAWVARIAQRVIR